MPAEATSKSPRASTALRNMPSAIGLRQVFPVQTKRTDLLADIGRTMTRGASRVKAGHAGTRDARRTIQGVMLTLLNCAVFSVELLPLATARPK